MQAVNNIVNVLNSKLPVSVEYFHENDGKIYAFTNNGIQTYGEGFTYEEAREDLLHGLREIADMIYCDIKDSKKINLSEIPYVLKYLTSSDEELRKCLSGAISEDF